MSKKVMFERSMLLIMLCVLLTGCGSQNQQAVEGSISIGSRTIKYDPSMAEFLPDPVKTPGSTRNVTLQEVCTPDYAKHARNVSIEEKEQIYQEYGIAYHAPRSYEVDHLIPLEIGGSNRKSNLWPQPYTTHPWNAHVKDKLENQLHDEICSGKLSIRSAQRMISTNWVEAYELVFHTTKPLSASQYPDSYYSRGSSYHSHDVGGYSSAQNVSSAPAVGSSGDVWVNTSSGKYFTPGQKWYGRTRRGEYMTKSQAVAQGYVHARGY